MFRGGAGPKYVKDCAQDHRRDGRSFARISADSVNQPIITQATNLNPIELPTEPVRFLIGLRFSLGDRWPK